MHLNMSVQAIEYTNVKNVSFFCPNEKDGGVERCMVPIR